VASPRPLIIGYGNSLRSDDGVGWHVARARADDPRAAGIDVIAAHQLTPELAADLHLASRVVLVDALADLPGEPDPLPQGNCRISALDPGGATGPSSHHHTPTSLAALARELYGSVPPVTLVGVGIASLEPGDTLTEPVASALPAIVDLILDLATGCHLY
jgi:hydrogenase maturation protease